uniref:Uncharacterized protein n=1 Tax=Solanum tuberosum TaxID=4113 RepID=M1E119_SOLTU
MTTAPLSCSTLKGKDKIVTYDVQQQYPFEGFNIFDDGPTQLMSSFSQWINEGLYKNHAKKYVEILFNPLMDKVKRESIGATTIKRERVDTGQLVVFNEGMVDAAIRTGVNIGVSAGIWIEKQSKDTNMQKRTKQTEEVKKGEPEDRQEHLAYRRVATLTA